MKRQIAVTMTLGVVFAATGKTSWAQVAPTFSFLEQSSERAKPGEEEQYAKGTQALSEGRFSEAASLFDSVAKMRGRSMEEPERARRASTVMRRAEMAALGDTRS